MAAPKRPTHVVIHPSLYFRVEGKLQELKKGDHLVLDAKAAESLVKKRFVQSLKDAETVDLSESESGKVKKLKSEIAEKDAEIKNLTEAAGKDQAEIGELKDLAEEYQAEIAKLAEAAEEQK